MCYPIYDILQITPFTLATPIKRFATSPETPKELNHLLSMLETNESTAVSKKEWKKVATELGWRSCHGVTPQEWVQVAVSQAIQAMAVVKAGKKISPLEELRLALSEDSTLSTVRSLAKSLVATGLPDCNAQDIAPVSKRLEEEYGTQSLQLFCLRSLAEQVRIGEMTIHAIPRHLARDVVALAVELEADKQIRQIFPDQLVDAFEGKLPYVPVLCQIEVECVSLIDGWCFSDFVPVSVVRWSDPPWGPGLAFTHNLSIGESGPEFRGQMDVIWRRTGDMGEWGSAGLEWIGRSKIQQYDNRDEDYFSFGEECPMADLVCKRVNALVHCRPLGEEVFLNPEFSSLCVEGPGMRFFDYGVEGLELSVYRPSVHLLSGLEW